MQGMRRHQFKVLSLVVCAMLMLPACTVWGNGTLVKDGQPAGCIVIREDLARGKLLTAGRDLAGYLEKMSGAVVPVVWATDHCSGFRVYVGSTQLQQVDPAAVTGDKVGFDGFIIKSVADGVLIAGRTDRGTANGVYHFAEHVLGAHWFTLEEDEPTCPQRATIEIPNLDLTVKPDFEWRGQYYSINRNYMPKKQMENHAPWSVFNRVWAMDGLMAHIFFAFVPDSLFETHPEYFALIDGKRTKGHVNVQRCLSNLDVLQRAIDHPADYLAKNPDQRTASLSANDGGGWCECDNCVAMGPTQSHRSFAFANAVAAALEDRFPNRGYSVIAYQATIEPPLDMKLHPNVVPWLCPMGKCRVHSIHSDCPDAVAKRRIVRGWQKLAGRFYWYPYLYGGPFTGPAVITMAEEMRFMRDHGCRGGFREHTAGPQTNWAMLNWMEVKLQWDVDLDPVRLRRQFTEGYYGQVCADAVERVYDRVETGLQNMSKAPAPDRPYGHNNMSPAYLGPVLAACRAEIDAAFEAARGETNRKFARRVVVDMANLAGQIPEDLKPVVEEIGSGRTAWRPSALAGKQQTVGG